MTTIVVICNNNQTRQSILNNLESLNCCLLPLNSLGELTAVLHEIPINGIIIDLITSTRATAEEKNDTFHILQLFPHIKVKLFNDEIRVIGNLPLEQFMQKACMAFNSRIIRKNTRVVRHIGVEVSHSSAADGSEKTFTYNFSMDGCYICSVDSWQLGERVWLKFIGFETRLGAVVCWSQPWGAGRKVPGIGVKFDPLPSTVREAFNNFWL